jgi:hypothetical protein
VNAEQPDDTHVDVTVPGPTLEDALLRVYIAGLGSGYISALVQIGLPHDAAKHMAGHVLASIVADPLPRNAAVESAMAAFHADPSWKQMAPGLVPLHIQTGGE